jgi:2-dehydropantoate 2-reductase
MPRGTSPYDPKVLIVGAGTIGSVYGARMARAGVDITILDQAARLEQLKRDGLVIEDRATGRRLRADVAIIDDLVKGAGYDLAIVPVRKTQAAAALARVAKASIPRIVIMTSGARGHRELAEIVGVQRVLLGFAGLGGRVGGDGVVRYRLAPRLLQKTTLGELKGGHTQRVAEVASLFRRAGFPVALCDDMPAWMMTHEAWISPFADAIYVAGGRPSELAGRPQTLHTFASAMKLNFEALDRLCVPITPARFRLLKAAPDTAIVATLRLALHLPLVETLAFDHANSAKDEMDAIAADLEQVRRQARVTQRDGVGAAS